MKKDGSVCMDCNQPIKVENHRTWGSSSVCHQCRVKRSHKSLVRTLEIHGKGFGSRSHQRPL